MNHNILQSPATTKRILITPNITLDEAKEITYLTKAYHRALTNDTIFPLKNLPELRIMSLANTIVNSYLNNINLGLKLKLYNACLPPEIVVAIWMFYNEPTLNIKIGNYQLLAIKHPNHKTPN